LAKGSLAAKIKESKFAPPDLDPPSFNETPNEVLKAFMGWTKKTDSDK